MKKTMTAAIGAGLLAGAANAHAVLPLVDIDVSATLWNASPSGHVQSGDRLDIDDDLDYSTERHNVLAARVAHPVPLIPNFRLRYNDFGYDGTGEVSAEFEGQSYQGEVDTDLDLTHLDYTIFYTAPLPFVTADLGFNFKHFVGSFDIEEQNQGSSDSIDFDAILPMLHAHGRVDLPLTGLGVGAELNWISFDGDSVRDLEAYVSYSYNITYVRAGYREFVVDAEGSGDLEVDADMSGAFLGVGVRF